MISVRLTADTSDAVKNIDNLGGSVEDLQRKLKAAQDAGDWGTAAQITKDISSHINAAPVGSSGGSGGSNLTNTVNTNNSRQLDIRLETITRVITSLTDQLKESTEKGLSKESFNLSAALNNAEQERRQLESEKKRMEATEKSDSSVMDMIKKYGVSRYLTQGLQYANQMTGIGFNHRIAMASGDYLGADVSAVESGAGIAQGLGNSMLGAGLMVGATPVGWGLMAAGGLTSIGGTIAKMWSGDARADIAEGEAYRKTLSTTNQFNKIFQSGESNWLDNSNKTDSILKEAVEKAMGTGLSTEDFINLATKQARFGGTQSGVMQQARDIATWANATGTDAGVIQNFLGTARRYGDDSDVIGYASQARQASGMTKAQNEEFISSLQTVIEDGIANGYIKSVEDVSQTFVMFSRLSNNDPLWQGEQAAKRISQMNAGVSSATALRSVSDVIVANAASDILSGKNIEQRNELLDGRATDTYIDQMLLMEQGNNPQMFASIAQSVKAMEGNNIAAQIERYKDIFKLNYSEAVDVYGFAQKIGKDGYTEEDFAKDVSSRQKDSEYQSEDIKWQNNINKIALSEVLDSKSAFWQNLRKIEGMADKTSGVKHSNTDTDVTGKALSVASSEEGAKKVAKKIEQESTVNLEQLETPIAVNYVASSVSQGLANEGDYSGAVKSFIQGQKGVNFAGTYGFSIDEDDKDNMFTNLHSDKHGNEELDKIAIERIGEYAAFGYKKVGSHKADGDVSEVEVSDAIINIQNSNKAKDAYKEGNMEAFLSELEVVLKKLFGEITIKSE